MSEHKWVWAVWEILGILTFLSGFFSENVVMMVIGATMAFAHASAYLTSYVEGEHRFKKGWEVISAIMVLGVYVYGYFITRIFILGVLTLFIAVMGFIAFAVSYLLPRIRSKSKNCSADVNHEGKKRGDFAYDVDRELGREMRKELEANWKNHVIAGVIAMGCGLPLTLLKIPWHFIIMAVFISYHVAYSALSKLFENKGEQAKK